jgi:N-acyl-L-homoserine lactone synthetase
MVSYAHDIPAPLEHPVLREMFAARKQVFVDLLGWDVPVIEDRYEVDQFDDGDATYLIVPDGEGGHAGSARLLATTRPHILDSLFPQLCAVTLPRGPEVLEITRFCLARRQGASARLETRNQLVSGIVDFALDHGIRTFTGVAELGWLQQILAFGWDCRPLGLPVRLGGRMLGALRIDVAADTPDRLAANGIYRPAALQRLDILEAA